MVLGTPSLPSRTRAVLQRQHSKWAPLLHPRPLSRNQVRSEPRPQEGWEVWVSTCRRWLSAALLEDPSVGDKAHGPALGWPGWSRTDPQGRSALGPAGPTATGQGPTWWSHKVLPGAWAPACQESHPPRPRVVYPSVPQQALGPNELSRGATPLWSPRAQETHRQRGREVLRDG